MAKRMREKALARKENADRRPQATARFVRISPSKVRIVLDIIRGKSYNDAMAILMGTPKSATEVLVKLLKSAGANAEFKNMVKDDLFVAEAYANEGPTYKRWWPRSHGSADQILKRTSHITIILDEKNAVLDAIKSEKKTVVKAEAKKVEAVAEEKVATPKKTVTRKPAAKTAAKPAVKSADKEKKSTTTKGGA
jgi:large subunit ribosomal protein L22